MEPAGAAACEPEPDQPPAAGAAVDGGVQRIFVMRHAEREDHVNSTWAATAFRTHDAPVSAAGLAQAADAGKLLAQRIPRECPLAVYSSPLTRCVETAREVLGAMGRAGAVVEGGIAVRVEQGLCEDEQHLRPRMLGIHYDSGPAGATAPDGTPRVECRPVLLGPSDLIGIARPMALDIGYRSTVQVLAVGETPLYFSRRFNRTSERVSAYLKQSRRRLQGAVRRAGPRG